MYRPPKGQKNRKCRFYQSDGRPYTRGSSGCPRSAEDCAFVHPEDPEWIAVLHLPRPRSRSRTPPPRRRPHSPSSHRSYSRGKSHSPPRGRSRSPHRESSDYSYPRSRSYRRTPPPAVSNSGGRRSPPHRSATADARAFRPDPPRSPDRGSLSTSLDNQTTINDPRSSRPDSDMSASRSRLPSGSRSLQAVASTSSSVLQSPASIHRARDSTPTSPDYGPMPPPPPPQRAAPSLTAPNPPSGVFTVTTPRAPAFKEVSVERKRAVWEERVKLVTNVISERMEYVKLGQDVTEQRRLIQSHRFAGLPVKDQDLAKRRLVAAEAKVTEKSRDISKLLRSLADSGFWPIVPPYNLEDFDAKFKDMKGSLGELHHATQLLQASLYNVTVQSLRRRGIPVPEEAQLSGGSDGAAGGLRPSKRRRVVDEEDGQDEEDGMQEAVENLTDRMEKLTQIVDELQNDFLQHNDNIIQEYSGVLEDAIDEIRHSIDPTEMSLSAATSTALAKLNEEYDLAHSDLDVITTEVVDVYGRIQALEQENVRLQQENAQWKALAETMAAKHEAQEGLLEKIKAETRALNAAITARLAEQPPPPPQPSLEVILESIREPVVRVARQDAERLINHNRASIESLMSRYQSQMQGPVYDKVMRSAQMADLMLAWIKQRDPEGLEYVRRMLYMTQQQGQIPPSAPSGQVIPVAPQTHVYRAPYYVPGHAPVATSSSAPPPPPLPPPPHQHP